MSFLLEMYERMRRFYENRAAQPWWPDDPLEVIVGAVLVQGTKWGNVAQVLETLKNDDLLNFQALLELNVKELEERIRSVGFQQRKAPALKGILDFLENRFEGNLDRFFSQDSQEILKQLLSIKGIGPQTAQNILQYGGNRNLYAVDKFTFRIFLRHGLIDKRTKNENIQRIIENELKNVPQEQLFPCEKELPSNYLFNEFQALLVRIGRDFCAKSETNCRECPLESLLPEGGPLDVLFESPLSSVLELSQRNQRNTFGNQIRQPQPPQPRYVPVLATGAASSEPIAISPESTPLPQPGPALPSYRPPLKPEPLSESPPQPVELSEQEMHIFSCVQPDGSPIDSVIVQSGLPTGQVLATLFALELKKLVKRCEGNVVART